ncbi:MAG: 4'-phosphopantetheinyl transferase superfamily protein [Verrucomicrobiota bacterium]|jgi:4'-phosphopantetheinyl transferase|nr:4'-phosphopantetheinyl transferase superfamily protein [Verrucomicrobiota bacterium]
MNLVADIPLQEWALPEEPFRVAAVEIHAADWEARLPPPAAAVVRRFALPAARARSGASAWLKQCWLPGQVGLETLRWEKGAHGRPVAVELEGRWGVNVTHAGVFAALALMPEAQLGVDLEQTARRVDWRSVSARYFSESEQEEVAQGGVEAFWTVWTQKEALLKALGCGWGDSERIRATRLRPVPFQRELSSGAEVVSRRILGGGYALAVAVLRGGETPPDSAGG